MTDTGYLYDYFLKKSSEPENGKEKESAEGEVNEEEYSNAFQK